MCTISIFWFLPVIALLLCVLFLRCTVGSCVRIDRCMVIISMFNNRVQSIAVWTYGRGRRKSYCCRIIIKLSSINHITVVHNTNKEIFIIIIIILDQFTHLCSILESNMIFIFFILKWRLCYFMLQYYFIIIMDPFLFYY